MDKPKQYRPHLKSTKYLKDLGKQSARGGGGRLFSK